MNPNQALWEKGDFTRIAATMVRVTRPGGRIVMGTLQRDLEALFARQDTSEVKGATSIPATFLRVTVTR